jgi:hypothetical protein
LAFFTKYLGHKSKDQEVDETYHVRKESEMCVKTLDGEAAGKRWVTNTGIILKWV